MTERDVAIERRRALIALVRANLVELRYIERRHALRAAEFDGRYALNRPTPTVAETHDAERGAVPIVVHLEELCSTSPSS